MFPSLAAALGSGYVIGLVTGGVSTPAPAAPAGHHKTCVIG